MNGKTLTLRKIADLTGLSPAGLRNYTSGRYQPKLESEKVIVQGPEGASWVETQVREEDFEIWWAAFQDKPAFGKQLHAGYTNPKAIHSEE